MTLIICFISLQIEGNNNKYQKTDKIKIIAKSKLVLQSIYYGLIALNII